MNRNLLLTNAYVGKPLVLNGRELCLSIGKYSLLEYWKNPLFCKDNPSGISEIAALGELIAVCYEDKDELSRMRRMTVDEREECVLNFMLEFDDEIGAVVEGITDRMKSIEAAGVVSAEPGKQEP